MPIKAKFLHHALIPAMKRAELYTEGSSLHLPVFDGVFTATRSGLFGLIDDHDCPNLPLVVEHDRVALLILQKFAL